LQQTNIRANVNSVVAKDTMFGKTEVLVFAI